MGLSPRIAALETITFVANLMRLWLLDEAGAGARMESRLLIQVHMDGRRAGEPGAAHNSAANADSAFVCAGEQAQSMRGTVGPEGDMRNPCAGSRAVTAFHVVAIVNPVRYGEPGLVRSVSSRCSLRNATDMSAPITASAVPAKIASTSPAVDQCSPAFTIIPASTSTKATTARHAAMNQQTPAQTRFISIAAIRCSMKKQYQRRRAWS